LFNPDGYIQQLHAAPGHVLPVLKSINENPQYQSNAIIQKYPTEVELMSQAAAGGFNLGYESGDHPSNSKAGEVVGSGVIAEMVQRVVLNGENADQVIGDTAKAIEDIMNS
jgi:multiple sugar transport system substrate-binding protein